VIALLTLAEMEQEAAQSIGGWASGLATVVVLLLAFGLVGAMFLVIRVMTMDADEDAPDKYKQLRDFVQALFGAAALRVDESASPAADASPAAGQKEAPGAIRSESFQEPCPACEEMTNQDDKSCPSCGLRLQ